MREEVNGQGKRVAIAIIVFSTCATLGMLPIELTTPTLAFLVSNSFLVLIGLSLIQVTYVVAMVLSLTVILQDGGGKEFLERGRVGRGLIKLLEHRKINKHQGMRWLCYEIKYHAILAAYCLPPLTRKIGIARCALYPKPLAIGAVCLGSIAKVYLLIYPLKLGWKLLNGN